MAASLLISNLFLDVIRTVDRRIPRPERPAPDEDDVYFRGVAHGYLTAFAWGDELIEAARQLAVLTGASEVARFLKLASVAADGLHAQDARSAVYFADKEPDGAA